MFYNLSENIRNLRQKSGLNQIEFGNILGVTKQCISNWENDNIVPSVEMLVKIAKHFNVTTDYLLGITHDKVLVVNDLNDEQIAHLSLIINDLKIKSK